VYAELALIELLERTFQSTPRRRYFRDYGEFTTPSALKKRMGDERVPNDVIFPRQRESNE